MWLVQGAAGGRGDPRVAPCRSSRLTYDGSKDDAFLATECPHPAAATFPRKQGKDSAEAVSKSKYVVP